MGDSLKAELVTKALKQAIIQRGVNEGLLHHSDKGCQYTSKEFKEFVNYHKIKLSMSGTGHCFDNAVAESFFHTLKTEHTNFFNYQIREEAKNSIFEYVEVFYNRRRLHSTIGYLSPEEFEHRNEQNQEVALTESEVNEHGDRIGNRWKASFWRRGLPSRPSEASRREAFTVNPISLKCSPSGCLSRALRENLGEKANLMPGKN